MVKWENDKNAYILGAALGALNATITNEICEGVIAGWPTNTLGEAPTLRAVKDQIKKLSSSSTSATTKRANGVKKFRATAAKGKDKGKGKSKKRTRDDDNDSADEAKDGDEEQEQQGDGDEERSPTNAKKQKVVVKQEQVDGNEDEEV